VLAFPIWEDEAYLCANLLDRGYLELLQPLDNHQVCPVLFLWVQAAITRWLGFSEFSLRLFPLICSVGSLLLFRRVAGRLLHGTALVFAVGFFAVGYPLIRYACEAKPYGTDLFASIVFLFLAVEWRQRRATGWLWALVAWTPIALGLSYPAVFTAGGVGLAVALALWSDRKRATASWPGWIACGAFGVILLASFAGVYCLSIHEQSAAELAWMQEYWGKIFPPVHSPAGMLAWLVEVHTSELLQYPMGAARGGSTLTTICCAAALYVLWRRRQGWLAVLCLAPLGLNLIAALMGRYPYGGSVRFVLYAAPMVCLLAGLGSAWLVAYRKMLPARRAAWIITSILAVIAVGSMARDFTKPYRTHDVLRQRDFARWFWFNKEYDGEVACWEADFSAGTDSPVARLPVSSIYQCNRRIYSPRHAAGRPVDFARVSAEHPLRVVRYGASHLEDDQAVFERWLADMRSRYDLVDCQRHTFPVHHKDRDLLHYNYLDLYEFVPKGQEPVGLWSKAPMAAQPKLR
jgi:hypothetical protein